MHSGSDTESDSEPPMKNISLMNLSPPPSPPVYVSTQPIDAEQRAKTAIDDLLALDVDIAQLQSGLISNRILLAYESLYCLLDEITTDRGVGIERRQIGNILPLMFATRFLHRLFDYRSAFHCLAARELDSASPVSTIICWVDVTLVKLCDALLVLIAGFSFPSTRIHISSLAKQKYDDALCGASQLPHKWESLPGVISSPHSSPVARRIALHLLCGHYFFGIHNDHGASGEISDPDIILDHLYQCATRFSLDQLSLLSGWARLQERMTYAIVLSLFAHADLERRRSASRHRLPPSPWKPRCLGLLLKMIHLVLVDTENNSVPSMVCSILQSLDPAQAILIRFGTTAPWSWLVWDDPRVADSDNVDTLTMTWLFHLDGRHLDSTFDVSRHSDNWCSWLRVCLSENTFAAKSVLLRILRRVTDFLSTKRHQQKPDRSMLDVLYKTSWAVNILFFHLDPLHRQLVPQFGSYFLGLYVLLDDSKLDLLVKHFVLGFIAGATGNELELAMNSVQDRKDFNFLSCADDLITNRRKTSLRKIRAHEYDQRDVLAVKSTLDFLSILWFHNQFGLFHRQTVSPFLSSLLDCLAFGTRTPAFPVLTEALLVTMAVVEVSKAKPNFQDVNIFWETETVWHLALTWEEDQLFIAIPFAHYIMASETSSDHLLCCEAWNYFRDLLIQILSHQFHEDEEELALFASPILCQALLRLIVADAVDVGFMLRSPWTLILCADLRSLLISEKPESEYSLLMKGRLEKIGQELLDAIHCISIGKVCLAQDDRLTTTSILYCDLQNTFHLLLST